MTTLQRQLHHHDELVSTYQTLQQFNGHLEDRKQEGLAVASIARDDPSTLLGDHTFPRARMHRDRNAR